MKFLLTAAVALAVTACATTPVTKVDCRTVDQDATGTRMTTKQECTDTALPATGGQLR